jgi:hypothetical protein
MFLASESLIFSKTSTILTYLEGANWLVHTSIEYSIKGAILWLCVS